MAAHTKPETGVREDGSLRLHVISQLHNFLMGHRHPRVPAYRPKSWWRLLAPLRRHVLSTMVWFREVRRPKPYVVGFAGLRSGRSPVGGRKMTAVPSVAWPKECISRGNFLNVCYDLHAALSYSVAKSAKFCHRNHQSSHRGYL